jgi:hypothetical protein
MLGAFGLGAVIGALNVGTVRAMFSSEGAIRACLLTMGVGIAGVSLSSVIVYWRLPPDAGSSVSGYRVRTP